MNQKKGIVSQCLLPTLLCGTGLQAREASWLLFESQHTLTSSAFQSWAVSQCKSTAILFSTVIGNVNAFLNVPFLVPSLLF